MSTSGSVFPSWVRSTVLSVLVAVVMLGVMFWTGPEKNSAVPPGGGGKKTVVLKDSKCDADLSRVLNGLSPGQLGISTQAEDMVLRLNSWLADCGMDAAELANLKYDPTTAGAKISQDVLQRMQNERFIPEDAIHIRECLLAREVVEDVVADAKNDTERAVALFNFVNEAIALGSTQLILTPYDALVFGVGTPADRAWAFASLLKQLRIDTVIIQPQESSYWLVGVITTNGTLLFDPVVGSVVPSPDDEAATPFPTVPATLAQAQQSDAVLRVFDVPNSPYPLTSELLRNIKVEVIGTASTWSQRIAQLQFLLPSDVIVELFDGVTGNAIRSPGLLERVASANQGWKPEQVDVWQHPITQMSAYTDERGVDPQLATLEEMFAGPLVYQVDPTTNIASVSPRSPNLEQVRLQMLVGESDKLLRHLLEIRNAQRQPVGKEGQIHPPNVAAADHAAYWTGHCQADIGSVKAAVDSFSRYLKSHPDLSAWSMQAIDAQIHLLAEAGAIQQAGQLILQLPPQALRREHVYLMSRWSKILGLDNPFSPKTEPMPEPTKPTPDSESQASPTETSNRPPSVPTPERIPN